MSYKLIEHQTRDGKHQLTYESSPGFWGRLFGRKPFRRTFEGSGAVWHELPNYKRCNCFDDSFLCDEITRLTSPFNKRP